MAASTPTWPSARPLIGTCTSPPVLRPATGPASDKAQSSGTTSSRRLAVQLNFQILLTPQRRIQPTHSRIILYACSRTQRKRDYYRIDFTLPTRADWKGLALACMEARSESRLPHLRARLISSLLRISQRRAPPLSETHILRNVSLLYFCLNLDTREQHFHGFRADCARADFP